MATEEKKSNLCHKFFEDSKTMIGKVKHSILESYLGAWFAKLSQNVWRTKGRHSPGNPDYTKMIYIDGFAGWGSYGDDKELGSPTLTYRLALDHPKVLEDGPEIVLIFIEKDPKNCEELLRNLRTLKHKRLNAKNARKVRCMVINGDFVSAMKWILSKEFRVPEDSMCEIYSPPNENSTNMVDLKPLNFQHRGQRRAHSFITQGTPLFVFVDPFGYNGENMPMTLMREIFASSRKAEIFINIMTGSMQRFYKLDSRTRPMNLLAGFHEHDVAWKEAVLHEDNSTAAKKNEIFLDHYFKNLSVGLGNVCFEKFEMRDERNKLKYHLCFACQHPKSLDSMKKAMTRVTHQEGEFKFSGFIEIKGDDRPVQDTPKVVHDAIIKKFSGQQIVAAKKINDFLLYKTQYVQKYRVQLKELLKKYRIRNLETKKFDEMTFSFVNIVDSSCDEPGHSSENSALALKEGAGVRRRKRKVERRENKVLHKVLAKERKRRLN